MKKLLAILVTVLLAVILVGCGEQQGEQPAEKQAETTQQEETAQHEHTWIEATCTEPKTCSECGETEGEPLGHTWEEATCTEPRTCSVCGETESEAAGHTWIEATCTEPKTCSVCGETEGEPLGHTWAEATCTEPKTCTVCGETEGEPLGHTCEKWTRVKRSTCSEPGSETGVCTVCGETITRETEFAEHKPGKWEIEKRATLAEEGTKVIKCRICGEVLESETYTVDSFDISPIRYKYGFTYDEFSKSWKYLYKHDKVFSDALESVWIVVYSEDYGTNIAEVDIRASLTWRDAANSYMTVKGVEILIGDDVYHVDMIESPNERYSYSVLYNETSYNLIEAISKAYSLKIKVIYDNTSDIIELWTNPFRNLCGDIVRYNMWDYYIPNDYLSTLDTTTVR